MDLPLSLCLPCGATKTSLLVSLFHKPMGILMGGSMSVSSVPGMVLDRVGSHCVFVKLEERKGGRGTERDSLESFGPSLELKLQNKDQSVPNDPNTYFGDTTGFRLKTSLLSHHHPAMRRLDAFPLNHSPIYRFSLSPVLTYAFVIPLSFTSPPSIHLSFPSKKYTVYRVMFKT